MYIPSYQIHNVLKVYSRQVSQSRIAERQKDIGSKPSADKIEISAEGKRQVIIDKVAADIVERITTFGPQDPLEQDVVHRLQEKLGDPVETDGDGKESEFLYNVIDGNNEKTTSSLSMEGAHFISNRLEQLVKEEVDKNMETPGGTNG